MDISEKIRSMGWSHGCIRLREGDETVWFADAVVPGTRHLVKAGSEQEALEALLYELTGGDVAAIE